MCRNRQLVIWSAALLVLSATAAAAAKGPLDGKAFRGETGEQGKAKGDKEEFVFKDGTFDPLECHQYGFAATAYKATVEGETVRFEADHTNKKGDRMRWVGTVKGDLLEGTMTYWEGKQAPAPYWFKATLKR